MKETPLFPPTKNTPHRGPQIKKIQTARKKKVETPSRPLEEIRVTVVSELNSTASTPLMPSRATSREPLIIRRVREPHERKEGYLPWSMIAIVIALAILVTYQLFTFLNKMEDDAESKEPKETFKLPEIGAN